MSAFTGKFYTLVSAATLPLLLGACSSVYPPNAMPTGYRYHQDTYKSALPMPSGEFTTLQRHEMGPEQAEQFRMAVYDLISRLTEKAGLAPKPVYVMDPEQQTPFYTTIGNDLREAMRYLGYVLSDTPEGAYVFSYSAEPLNQNNGNTVFGSGNIPVSTGEPNVSLAFQIYDSVGEGSRLLTEQRGAYFIKGIEYYRIPEATFPDVPPVRNDEQCTRPATEKQME